MQGLRCEGDVCRLRRGGPKKSDKRSCELEPRSETSEEMGDGLTCFAQRCRHVSHI